MALISELEDFSESPCFFSLSSVHISQNDLKHLRLSFPNGPSKCGTSAPKFQGHSMS